MTQQTIGEVGGINRTPPVPALDGRDIAWLIEQYRAAAIDRLGDGSSVTGYRYKLAWFLTWWQEVGPDREWMLTEAALQDLERWLRNVRSPLTGRLLSYSTRHDVLRRLREALRWAFRYNYVDRDYSKWVPEAQGGPNRRVAVSLEALNRLLDAATTSVFPHRDQTIIAVLIGTGIRRTECASLQIENIRFEDDGSGVAKVTGKRTRANQTGVRDVVFDTITGDYLREHLATGGHTSGPLFRNKWDEALTPQGVYKVVKRAAQAAGLGLEIQGCHDLRRAFATHYLRLHKGPDAGDRLRRQMGHANYSMTTFYTLLDANDLRDGFSSPMSMLEEDAANGKGD